MEQKLLAGYHKVKVTPPLGLPVPGYFAQRTSDGIISDLYLRCTAFAQGEKKALVFSLDALSLNAQAFDIVADMITEATGVEADGIYITCVHSHTAFRVTKPSEELSDTDVFLHWLFKQFASCAKLALEDLKPCTVKAARGEVKGVGFVRLYRMADGSAKTNPGFGKGAVERLGEQDDQVILVRVIREGGSEILMVNYGTHADTVGGSKYCADWPGYVCDNLENAFDGQADAMVLVGAEGNSNHMDFFMPEGTPWKDLEFYTKRMARNLAGEVLKIYDSAAKTGEAGLSYGSRITKVGKNDYDPADVPMAQELCDLYKKYGNYHEPIFDTYPMKVPEALRIIRNLSNPDHFELRVSGLQVAGIGFAGIPGEPFVSIGMDIKTQSPLETTLVTCQTNGSQGYYPDALAFAQKDGYERTSSNFAPNCGQVLAEEAVALLNELK